MYKKRVGLFCLLLLIFALSVSLFSCTDGKDNGSTDGGVTDPDGSDTSREPVDTSLYIPITEGGEGRITIVSSYSKEAEYASAYNAMMSSFSASGIKLKTAYEASEDTEKPEILIGDGINVSSEYYIDPHSLGDEGYAIRVIGNKIVIAGGTADSLAVAIDKFTNDVLDLDGDSADISDLAVPRATDIFIRQYYPIQSVSIGGRDLKGYDIVADIKNADQKYCADRLQSLLYDNAGYWLNVKSDSNNPSIRLKTAEYAGVDGFRVYVEGVDLIVECAYESLFKYAFNVFVGDFFESRDERSVSFGNDIYTVKISSLCYADFGAVGDGVTDDYEAIKAAHETANRTGQTVIAESGKTYYLGQHGVPITVKTNTVWTGATFIVDDSTLLPDNSASKAAVFHIQSSYLATPIVGIKSLSKGQTNVGMTFDGPTLLYLVYDGNKQYIRYGANADSGASQQEIILVDKDGNVDPSTPILWDYSFLSSVAAYPAYDVPITIEGGTFITRANAAPREYTYFSRNIVIKRSNVTVDGLTHLIEGEGDTGAPYNGFISISFCNNILVKNTVLTGHKVYKLSSDANNSMGTYDISISYANNVTFKNCTQTNSITDSTYWGIMGSNYCKNLTYDGCKFSRFDAHKGTHNATIINSEIGYQRLNIIGSGLLTVENTVVHSNSIINLRNDYGSTWDGDIVIRNVTLNNTNSTPTLINANWYNHYFGYTCYLPRNITLDGITLAKGTSFYVLPALKNGIDTDTVSGVENKNKIVLTERITVKSNPMGYNCYVSTNRDLYGNVELLVKQEGE